MLSFASRNYVVSRIKLIDDETFRMQRYDQRHKILRLDDGSEAIYMLHEEKKIGMIAYLVDLTKISKHNLYESFYRIAKKEHEHISLVAYPTAKLPFFSLLRMPIYFLPRKLHFVGMKLLDTCPEEFYLKIKNWKINLSNFDVR